MEQVKAAALAPSDPSPQDLKVAQTADMMISKAMQEARNEKNNNQNDKPTMKIDIYA
jgi:hypothetical protein